MAHMVQQVIKYSDGTETVINYRGVIVDGVLTPNEDVKMSDEKESEEVKLPEGEVPTEVVEEKTPAEQVGIEE